MLWSTSKPGTCILHTLQETTTMKVVFMTMTNDHCYSNDQDLRPIKLPQNCGNPNSMSYENSSMPASLKLGPGEPSKLLVQEYSWVKFLGPNNNLNENLCDVEKACPTGSPGQHPSRDGREHLCGLPGSGCLWGGLWGLAGLHPTSQIWPQRSFNLLPHWSSRVFTHHRMSCLYELLPLEVSSSSLTGQTPSQS